jgi:hypothetical protein
MTMALISILLVGCPETVEQGQNRHSINSSLINTYHDIAVRNAIISQHTLYPYHFVKNSAELNELGHRDFGVLAAHFMKNPGQLNIRHGGVSVDLYKARIELVLNKLKETGINTEEMSIADSMPGGSGMLSEKIVVILKDEYETSSTTSKRSY